MEFKRDQHLFSPSGCLSEEGLLLRKLGLLSEDDLRESEKHLESCELCSAAAEGFALADSVLFSRDVAALNADLESTLLNIGEKNPETEPADIKGIQGPQYPRMSADEIRNFTKKIKESSTYPAGVQAQKNVEPEKKPGSISFWRGHRTELIAAGILLLMAVGSWQIFFQYKKSDNSGKLAVVTETSDTVNENAYTNETETRIASDLKTEKLPASPARTEQNKTLIKESRELLIFEDDAEVSELVIDTNTLPLIAAEAEIAELSPAIAETVVQEDMAVNPAGMVARKSASGMDNKAMPEAEEEMSESEIFTVVEETPQFPGGDEMRLRFLSENLKYPQAAREASVQGTVYISFVIEADGTITNTRIVRGIGQGCDEEALRVIQLMPKWQPGKQRGKPVRVQFNMPVRFSLAG
ncbi:MAG: TonB family protein [Lentimicrobium sp.]|nr:TonB family protein [Lentimicrobium sp.]